MAMSPGTKRLVAGSVATIAVAAAIVVIVMQASDAPAVDGSVANVMQSYTCAKCGNKFDLSVADAAAMKRSGGEVLCPGCGEGGAAKDDVTINFGAPLSRIETPEEEESDDSAVANEDKPKAQAGVMKKKTRDDED